MTLDLALDRLIHKRSVREQFLRGSAPPILAADEIEALAAVDVATLADLADQVARSVLLRRHAGSGSLLDLFPLTLAAYRATCPHDVDLVELALSFMDSAAFDDYREHPHAGLGSCLEESFYRYAESVEIGDAVVREREFLAAMMKLLTVSPRAAITLPLAIRRVGRGFFAVTERGTPTLFASLDGRFVMGELTPFLADLLRPGSDFARAAECHGVSRAVLDASVRHLSALGLFESGA